MNVIYRRSESNWIGQSETGNKSANYWRLQARRLFESEPEIEAVEVVKTGRKTDSLILKRGQEIPPSGFAVIIASTGGKWGKSRRNFV